MSGGKKFYGAADVTIQRLPPRPATVEAALLQDVLAEPYEDAPRLILADWLEDNGNAGRAAFIRYMMRQRLERMEVPNGQSFRFDTVTGESWADGLNFRRGYRRGFVERIELSLAEFERHAKELFAAHPITEVGLSDRAPNIYTDEGRDAGLFAFESATPADLLDQPLPGYVPQPLWNLLRLSRNEGARGSRVYFATRGDAASSLSRACVAYGRELAGLPALKEVDPS